MGQRRVHGEFGKERHLTIMKSVFVFLAVSCMVAFVTAEPKPRFRALEKLEPKLGCTLDELIKCEREIAQAVEDCGHLTGIDEITKCINDILGATDCINCICDVIPQLC